MMRGMYSAISGLKTHQITLDVTANDLANVNTVGYKAARTTFKDSLHPDPARRRRLRRRLRRRQPGPGRPRRARSARSTTSWPTAPSRRPATRSTSPSRATAGSASARGVPTAGNPIAGTPAADSVKYTRAGNFTPQRQGYLITQDGDVRHRPHRRRGGGTDCYISIPAGATDVAVGADGAVTFVPPAGYVQPGALPPITRPRDRRLPVAREVPERGRPRARDGQPLARRPERRRRDRRHARPERPTARPSAARSRCRTSTSRPSSPT